MSEKLKLPVGISSFEVLRENGFLYVDKTAAIYRMVDEGRYYFMARPRRFGKTLLVSTLRCLFEGRRELFTGLWIAENTDWAWEPHPVVLLDFNQISHDTPAILKTSLERELQLMAQRHQLEIKEPLLEGQFKALLLGLSEHTGQSVVVLVDEYDKPIIDHLGRGPDALEIARANRDVLRYFFGVLKGGDVSRVLRLVFLTGISRFSKVSIFSELNNLEDLTVSTRYADLLGYTQDELEHDFQPHLTQFAEVQQISIENAIEQLQHQYDGYRFSPAPVRVYNPFSTLRALRELRLENYWFETGTPAFLVNLLKERQYPLPQIEQLTAPETIFGTYDLDNLQPEALLFQTGYITITDIEGRLYHFGYPNQEVKTAFLETLLYTFAGENKRPLSTHVVRLAGHLRREDFDAFFETIQAIFASIPYTLNTQRNEAYFHTLFYLMVSASGVEARSELLTSRGRIDLAVEFSEAVFIMEFKCGQSPHVALRQIAEQGYAERYRGSGKRLWAMGLEFDTEERNLVAWDVEALN
ncbi:MAG: AAA family ATPase [Anaerolineales bacterium]